MSTFTFGKILDGLFSSGAPTNQSAAAVAPDLVKTAAHSTPIIVGTGASSERYVTIAGEPALFRDEGDVVVQFRPAFDYDLRETAVGMKLIPALMPHWAMVREFSCSVTEAIATAIKESSVPSRHLSQQSREQGASIPARVSPRADIVDNGAPHVEDVKSTEVHTRRSERSRFGLIKEWGEKSFPDGKRPGKTYESFCLTLAHRGETHVLQGEGLRDAIADANCTIGDSVEVKRLGKIKVPAVDKRGRPKLDAQGAQVLWDKWQWSIRKKS
jgi:hypothetical protein